MRPDTRLWTGCACAAMVLAACQHGRQGETGSSTLEETEAAATVAVDMPSSKPAERDDAKAPLLRVELRGSPAQPVAVPYLYGYPLYADGPALQGVRMLRQENWTGYMREERKNPDGVMHVIESFPELGCFFEGVQQDDSHYVPLYLECDLPAPKERGSKRPVVGQVGIGAKVDAVTKEPSLAKAFLGEWHAKTPDFDGGSGAGYFDTAYGLLGFGFKKNKLNSVAFVFDAPEQRWRKPELWQAPLGYTVGQ
jgi:hypothetical protein